PQGRSGPNAGRAGSPSLTPAGSRAPDARPPPQIRRGGQVRPQRHGPAGNDRGSPPEPRAPPGAPPYRSGTPPIFLCGVGLDALTLGRELVSIACFDADAFDRLFGDLVVRNSEGFIRGKEMRSGRVVGYDLTSQTVSDLIASKRLSPAAQAALSAAWGMR